ncbi:MAG: TraB/GumN family protein [Rhizobiaceae bacterium]
MTRAMAIADVAAGLAFRLLLAAHVLFFLSFAAFLYASTQPASSEAAVCTGKDLTATLADEDPDMLADISKQAGATQNGRGLLWKVETPGSPASWLFGTMHVTDPRVTDLPAPARAAFDGAATLVIETTEILDQKKMMAALMAQPELMMFTDDTTLYDLIPEADRAVFDAGLEARGIPPASVIKMKPWMLAAMVALPACEMARKEAGEPVLDVKLAHDAEAGGKTVVGMETVAEQLGAMASLPMEFHVDGLIETLRLGERMDDVIETMVQLYEREETGMFWPLFRAVLPSGADHESSYVAFEETMIKARNRTMAERAAPYFTEGNAFVAVGALHLAGPEGLVELLRSAGYTVTGQP